MKKRLLLSFSVLFLTLLFLSPSQRAEAASTKPIMTEGEYTVVAKILPILRAPDGKYKFTDDGGVEYSDDVEGVVVYGNKLKLRPEGGVFALLSLEKGSVLGYIPAEGVEPFHDCEPTGGALYMVARDDPALTLMPDGRGGRDELPGNEFAVYKGEVIPSYGRRNGKVLLRFGSVYGEGGVGHRYAWANETDLIALDTYKPDNSKADRALIPSVRRMFAGGAVGINVEAIPRHVVESIEKRGFLIDGTPILPEEYGVTVDDMADLYFRTNDYEADFITTDIFLHSFHLLFDQMLQKFERTCLAPRLAGCLNEALAFMDRLEGQIGKGATTKQSLDTARDMLAVSLALLSENPNSVQLSPRAGVEVKRAMDAAAMHESEITGQKIDYTLFKPRGHYTISPEFERYFRAVNYIGLAELPLFDQDEKPIEQNIATVAVISLAQDANREIWEAFEDPMTFLVGVPNAGDPKLYREIVRKCLDGGGENAWRLLGDSSALSRLAQEIAEKMPGPKIQSVIGVDKADSDFDDRSAVFRISPKRFTYDAYIMNRLTSPRVGTDSNPRNIPKGTDVMAVFGSPLADALTKSDHDKKNYKANLAALKGEVAGYLAKENTVYANWLEAFRAGFVDSGSEQFFYRSAGWQWKKLATNLASWAELKHDTILYAEQSAAEMGDGGDWYAGRFEPPQAKGYVEPDPQFFEAMLRATRHLLTFIKEYGVEANDSRDEVKYSNRLEKFSEMLESMRNVAQKEVDKKQLTPDEYESIKQTARAFDAFLLLPGDGYPMDDGELRKMACVADVATNGFEMTVLETAVGTPRAIYVFANDQSGGARVTKGYVFSYYEFEYPMSERMTDEEWRAIVYAPNRADELEKFRPSWYGEFKKNTQ